MDFTLSEERQAYRDLARAFAAAELTPNAARWDETATFPVATLRRAAALGFGAIYVRQGSGGTGLGRLDAALIFEELAAGCTATAAYLSIHNMVAWMIDAFGDDAQRARWLPDLVPMTKLASYGLTEPDSGSDAASLACRAVRADEAYVVDGAKAFVSGAGASDLYMTMVRTGPAGPRGISCLGIETGTAGLSFGPPERKMGWTSQPTAAVYFEGCRVPVGNRVGAEGEG
ncbi:MAG: acyl-CoA dehydrogenase family protein, partial [Alphaproteobacteria bacterium]